MVRPFRIEITEGAVAELKGRLAATRFPAGVVTSGGISYSDVSRLVSVWQTGYDWFAAQERLNGHPQVVVDIGATTIHAVHLRAGRSSRPAILLLHGWPGSFVELLTVGEILAHEFDVVIPSIPGFGFSGIPTMAGVSNAKVADWMADLMSALGYDEFAVHGGDIGAGVASWMALEHPTRLTFLHLNFIPGSYWPEGSDNHSPEEVAFTKRRAEWTEQFGAYAHMQRTTPLTPAYALSDSPAGLAAWLGEKFLRWSDPASAISDDVLLTNLSIYWFTNTIASSMRFYLESASTPLRIRADRRIGVETHIAHFPHEIVFPPASWVERGYAVRRWTEMPRGGHFAALEAPELLAADILACRSR